MPTTPGTGRPPTSATQLLDGALSCFAARGFTRVSMTDLAAACGVTKPTLYARIGNKEQLFTAVVGREVELLTERLTSTYARVADAPISARVGPGMHAFFAYAAERRQGFHLLYTPIHGAPALNAGDAALSVATDHLAEQAEAFFRHRRRRDPVRDGHLLAAMLVSVARGAALTAHHTDGDFAHAERAATAFALAALQGQAPAA